MVEIGRKTGSSEKEPGPKNPLSRTRSRITPTKNDVVLVEKQLPNGDLYIGRLSGNVPEGVGKYLWCDGCMYEGEWKKGRANGKGKFSWASGARYEGEFKSGRMEGKGTFTGWNGGMYKGNWVTDQKHGKGERVYDNGDYYCGDWMWNFQDGVGKYVWSNGCWYFGEWRNGIICGNGVLVFPDGTRVSGVWDNGVCKTGSGSGLKCGGDDCVFGNGKRFDGVCKRGSGLDCFDHGYGLNPRLKCGGDDAGRVLFAESLNQKKNISNVDRKVDQACDIGLRCGGGGGGGGGDGVLFGESLNSKKSNEGCNTNTVEKEDDDGFDAKKSSVCEMMFPRICIWENEGEDITCDIIDNVEVASMIYGDGFSSLDRKGVCSPCCFIKEAKKPGHTISKGHKNYDLMLNLQIGIRYSVGKHSSVLGELKPRDFDPKEKFWTRFPPEGTKLTPTHKSTEFRWKDYCPVVFRHLRDLFQVDTADYMLAICGNDALRELSSPGKSGSFFYLTQDDRFMIKTVKKCEVKVLLRMLPSYYQHVYRYENTLVTRFYGVHCVKPAGGPKTRFIVIGNLFCSEYRIHRRFDLKGSRHGRTTEKAEGEIDETTTLKDLDLDFDFRLQRNWYQELIKQIERDCEFLEAEKIMDYSLLVGIHFRNDTNTMDKIGLSPFVLRGKKASYQNEKYLRGQRFLEAELQDMDRVLAGRKPLIRLGANMPARAERLARRSDFDQYIPGGCGNLMPSRNRETYEVILYFGIIDILQDYDISKRLEHAYKSLQADPTSISAVDPKLYSKRFRDFIGRIFVQDR